MATIVIPPYDDGSRAVQFAAPSQVFVPVRADGNAVRDNGGEIICLCFTAELATRLADLINNDARA